MANESGIEWTDSTFNPWIGCTKVAPGCDNCYAEADFDHRRHRVKWGSGQERSRTSPGNWQHPVRWNADAEHFAECSGCGTRGDPRTWRKDLANKHPGAITCCPDESLRTVRRRVFCASLADVFDNEAPREWRMDLFSLIAKTPNLDWLVLTKRIGNVQKMCTEDGLMFDQIANRVWLGATICNQEEAYRDIPKLLSIPAKVRFLSMEPLLGLVDLSPWINPVSQVFGTLHQAPFAISWIIVGGESGPKARPMSPIWARSLRDQCAAAGVPFLFKQWGEWAPGTDDTMVRVGKKAAGRTLDDQLHSGYPK